MPERRLFPAFFYPYLPEHTAQYFQNISFGKNDNPQLCDPKHKIFTNFKQLFIQLTPYLWTPLLYKLAFIIHNPPFSQVVTHNFTFYNYFSLQNIILLLFLYY